MIRLHVDKSREALPAGAPLRRLTPLRRTGLRETPPSPSRRVPLRSGRDTGPSAKVRRPVLDRSGLRCENCGDSVIGRPYSIQPRVAPGRPSTSRAEANALWNLSLLCGSASSPGGRHLLCEQDEDMHDRGFWLWPRESPALVPVRLFNLDGPRILAWLSADGRYSFERPAGVA